MRILLLSCNTGEGHNATAKAIMQVLESSNISCELRDVLACLSPRFSKFISNWHVRLYKYAPRLFDVGYRAFERSEPDPEDTSFIYELLRFSAGKLLEILAEGNFDAVVCTHVFSGMMMTEVRRAFRLRIPCFFVATDYTCYPMTEQCEMDGYFIPDAALTPEYEAAGVPVSRLIPYGIPVRQDFYQPSDQPGARQLLQLPSEGLVVLLMCGSMGCGPIKKIARNLADRLPENATVVAVCGNNEKLYESMIELQDPRLRILGFTRQIAAYMDAADIIVTKPGGLSTTEASAKHLPMVLFNTVGGCESRNFDFYLSRGYALGSDDAEETVNLAISLAMQPDLRRQLRQTLEAAFPDNGGLKIAHHIMQAAEAYSSLQMHPSGSAGIQSDNSGHPFPEEGGCNMDQGIKQTCTNLARAFAGESQARTRYTIYAKIARKEGKEWIARIFEETAANEAVHAEEFLEMLQKLGGTAPNIDLAAGYPFQLGATEENLQFAAEGELHEHDDAYPGFAEIARREGYDDAARLWMQIARIEGVHHNTFASLHEQLVSGSLTQKDQPITWRCLNCGYTYEGIRACDPCPVCNKDVGWQSGDLDQKKMLPKK